MAERGSCVACCGSTVDLDAGEVCHWCGAIRPHPDDEDQDDEDALPVRAGTD